MGTFLPNGYGIWKPTLTLDGSTKIFQTALMFRNDGVFGAFTAGGIFRGQFTTTSRPFAPSQMYVGYTLAYSETYVMAGGLLTYDIDSSSIVGTKASALGTPINTSILINKATGIVGKKYRGRVMLPNMWVAESNVSQAGIIDSSGLTLLSTLWGGLQAALNTAQVPVVLGHSSSEVLPTFITSLTASPKLGSMPHRIRGF